MMEIKNILIVRSKVNIGGPGAQITATIRELKKRGNRVVLICGGGEKLKEIQSMDVQSYVFPALLVEERKWYKNFKLIIDIRKIIKKEKIEVVYGYNSTATILAYLAGLRFKKKIKYINFLLGSGKYWFHRKMPFKHICMSEEHKAVLVANGLKQKDLYVNYPSTLDEEIFKIKQKGRIRKELGISKNDIVIGVVMNGNKGNYKLPDIIKEIYNKYSNMHWVFVGNTIPYTMYKSTLNELKDNSRLHFLGVRNDITDIMADIDILSHYLAPHDMETFGMVITEAMYMETAIIASSIGGIKEIVLSGETGYLVSNNIEYKSELIRLLENPEIRIEMGKKGKERVLKKFTIQKSIDVLETITEQI